jgi:hypothetical protein
MLTAGLVNLLDATVNKLNKAGEKKAYIRRDIDANTTHIIAASKPGSSRRCARSMKFFKGVAMGLWVVTPAWLQACHDSGKWLPCDEYEVLCGEHDRSPPSSPDTNGYYDMGGPKKSRLDHANTNWRRTGGTKKLLDNITLCFLGNFTSISLKVWDLKRLAMMAGAKVVGAPKRRGNNSGSTPPPATPATKCDFVLCPKNIPVNEAKRISQQTGLPVVAHSWLLDSIGYWDKDDPLSKKWLLSNFIKSSRTSSKIASP